MAQLSLDASPEKNAPKLRDRARDDGVTAPQMLEMRSPRRRRASAQAACQLEKSLANWASS
eukprot:996424-Pleurochrysis_carterae.AAC.2